MRVGRSRAAVTNLLRLLELAPEVAELLEKRQLEMGHARAVLPLTQRRQQTEVARMVIAEGLSVRQTESIVRQLLNPTPPLDPKKNNPAATQTDPNIAALQHDLTEKLGANVLIQQASGGKGKLVIAYNSLDELDGILRHIR